MRRKRLNFKLFFARIEIVKLKNELVIIFIYWLISALKNNFFSTTLDHYFILRLTTILIVMLINCHVNREKGLLTMI